MFTDDEDITRVAVQVLPILAIMQVFDAAAAGLHGLLRGIGRQYVGGYSNLLSFYLVALPISFSTGFALDWGMSGLWFGVTVGLVL
jgi:MATE family multidrug resistance protein